MTTATGSFPRTERIRRSREFQALSRHGRRSQGRAFVLLSKVGAPGQDHARLGVTVSRRVGNAVVRNRVKRRIREWFRQVGREDLGTLDVVVIARSRAAEVGVEESFEELSSLAAALESE